MTWSMRLNGGDLIRDGEAVRHETSGGAFTVSVIKEGTGFGNREPLTKTMNTLMTQGSWEVVERFGNRAPALVIEVEGETADGLNAGEVWLSALMTPGALEWLPPRQSVWTVFDVVTAHIERTEDGDWDLDEHRWVRRYRVPITALPHARSRDLVVTPANEGTPVDEVVNDGTSTAGWSGSWEDFDGISQPLTPTVVSGKVVVTPPQPTGSGGVHLRLATGPLPDDTPFLRIDVNWDGMQSEATLRTSAGDLEPVEITTTSSGTYNYSSSLYYLLPPAIEWIEVTGNINPFVEPVGLRVDQVRRLSELPSTGTGRQKRASLYPMGSAPAEGSLHVSHDTDALGWVLLHTYPIGRPSPDLMQYRTDSYFPAEDASQVSGERIDLLPEDLVLTVPEPQLPTRGLASLWAKLRVDEAATINWTVTPTIDGQPVGESQTGTVDVEVATEVIVPLGLITLASTVMGPDGAVVITLRRTPGTFGTVFADKVWAFGQDEESALTVVDCGQGTPAPGGPATDLWVNAPTVDRPAGEVLIGAGLGDAHWPAAVLAHQVHQFPSRGVSVLTVTCAAANAKTDLQHYRRWTHHAGA